MAKAKYTPEYKEKFVNEVLRLQKEEGLNQKQACAKAGGVNVLTFREWKKRLVGTQVVVHKAPTKRKYTRRAKTETPTTTTTDTSRVFMFVGSPKEVAEVMRSL